MDQEGERANRAVVGQEGEDGGVPLRLLRPSGVEVMGPAGRPVVVERRIEVAK